MNETNNEYINKLNQKLNQKHKQRKKNKTDKPTLEVFGYNGIKRQIKNTLVKLNFREEK